MIITLKEAIIKIKEGDVVAFPTETVYGLGADAFNLYAVKKTFQLKGRPQDNPLIVHIHRAEQMELFAHEIPKSAFELGNAYWPGPLTLVLKKRETVLDAVTGGLNTVALRIPDQKVARSLIEQSCPLTAPSANKTGRPSPTRVSHVLEDFGETLPVLDGGTCSIGIESTVLDLSSEQPAILRPGAISKDQIETVLNLPVTEAESIEDTRKSPGTRYSHYKPRAEVIWLDLNKTKDLRDDTLYVFHTTNKFVEKKNVLNFTDDFERLARSLYDIFRTADLQQYPFIQIEPLPHLNRHTLLPALENRIRKALSHK